MEYCINGLALVAFIFAIRAVFQIVQSSITGQPLNGEIEDFITSPTILYVSGGFTFGSGFGIYMGLTGQFGEMQIGGFMVALVVVFVISAILFLGGVTRIFRRSKH